MPRGWRVRRGGPTGRQGLAYRHTGSSDESRDDLSRTPRPPRPGRFLNATRRACPMELATSAIASRRRPLGSTSLVLRRSRREADNDYVRVSPATFDDQIEQPRFRPLPCSPGAPWPDASQGAGSPRRQYRAFAANRGRGRTPLVGWLRPVERGVAPSSLSNPERRANRRRVRYFTDVDHHDHEAIVALSAGDGRGVGVARFVRAVDDDQAAEVAVTVVDD